MCQKTLLNELSLINEAIREATRSRIQNFFKSQRAERLTYLVNALYLRRFWNVYLSSQERSEWFLPDATLTVLFIGDIVEFKFASTKSYRYVAFGCERGEMETETVTNWVYTQRNECAEGASA